MNNITLSGIMQLEEKNDDTAFQRINPTSDDMLISDDNEKNYSIQMHVSPQKELIDRIKDLSEHSEQTDGLPTSDLIQHHTLVLADLDPPPPLSDFMRKKQA